MTQTSAWHDSLDESTDAQQLEGLWSVALRRARYVLAIIVCGFMTHSSISTTVRAAKDYGYRCTLVTAACATRDIPTPDGGVLSARDLHHAEMAALGDNFAAVVGEAQALI